MSLITTKPDKSTPSTSPAPQQLTSTCSTHSSSDGSSIGCSKTKSAIPMNVKEEFVAFSNRIKGSGFAAMGILPEQKAPKLCVNGLDHHLSLPIQKDVAKKLMNLGEQAPFGKGEKTVVDKKVRDSIKINADACTFDKEWERTLCKTIVADVKQQMGIEASVHAELHNLLVYGSGGHFKVHKDSEKCPGMFATLIVTLPSKHRNGEFWIRHQGEQVQFLAAGNTDLHDKGESNDLRWCAFHADCQHELKYVWGHRVALVYNLIREETPPTQQPIVKGDRVDVINGKYSGKSGQVDHVTQKMYRLQMDGGGQAMIRQESATPAKTAKAEQNAQHALALRNFGQRWLKSLGKKKKQEKEEASKEDSSKKDSSKKDSFKKDSSKKDSSNVVVDRILFTLSHEYTEQGLAWDKLKGSDDTMGRVLSSCGDLFDLFLCQLKVEESGDEDGSVYGRSLKLDGWIPEKSVHDCTGWNGPSSIQEDVRGNDIFGDDELFAPDETENHGYTGNEGSPRTQWYRQSAFVIWPKVELMNIVSLSVQVALLSNVVDGKTKVMEYLFVDVNDMAQHVVAKQKTFDVKDSVCLPLLSCLRQGVQQNVISQLVLVDVLSRVTFTSRYYNYNNKIGEEFALCLHQILLLEAGCKASDRGQIGTAVHEMFTRQTIDSIICLPLLSCLRQGVQQSVVSKLVLVDVLSCVTFSRCCERFARDVNAKTKFCEEFALCLHQVLFLEAGFKAGDRGHIGHIGTAVHGMFTSRTIESTSENSVATKWHLLCLLCNLNNDNDNNDSGNEGMLELFSSITSAMIQDLSKCAPVTKKGRGNTSADATDTLGWCFSLLTSGAPNEAHCRAAVEHIKTNSKRFGVLKNLAFVLGQTMRHVKPEFQELLLNPLAERVVQNLSLCKDTENDDNSSTTKVKNTLLTVSADEIANVCVLLHDCDIPDAISLMLENKDRFPPESFITAIRSLLKFLKNSSESLPHKNQNYTTSSFHSTSSGSSRTSLLNRCKWITWIKENSVVAAACDATTTSGQKKTKQGEGAREAKTREEAKPFQYPKMLSMSVWPEAVLTAVSNFFVENVAGAESTKKETTYQLKKKIAKMQRVKQDFIIDAFLILEQLLPRSSFDHDPYLVKMIHRVIAMPQLFPVQLFLIPATKRIFEDFKPELQSLSASALVLLLDHEIATMEPLANKELVQKR